MKIYLLFILTVSSLNVSCQNIWLSHADANSFSIDVERGIAQSRWFRFFGRPELKDDTLIIYNKVHIMDKLSKPKKKKYLKDSSLYEKSTFLLEYIDSNTIQLVPDNLYSKYVTFRINNKSSESFSNFLKNKKELLNIGTIRLYKYSSCFSRIEYDSITLQVKTVSGGETTIEDYKVIKTEGDSLSYTWIDLSSTDVALSKTIDANFKRDIVFFVDHICSDNTSLNQPGYIDHGVFYDLNIYYNYEFTRIVSHSDFIPYQAKLLINLISEYKKKEN